MMHKLQVAEKRWPMVCLGQQSNLKVRRMGGKIEDLDLKWDFPDCNSIFHTDGYEIILKGWYGIEEVPHCFTRSSAKFQRLTGRK